MARLLDLMDPLAGEQDGSLDPLLARFFFWGGLYIALGDGLPDSTELSRLETVAPPDVDVGELARERGIAPEACLESFRAAKEERRAKLSAVELHKIVHGLIDVAAADGRIDRREVEHLYRLGEILGIRQTGCDLLVAQYRKDTEGDDNVS